MPSPCSARSKSWRVRTEVPSYWEIFKNILQGTALELVGDCSPTLQQEALSRLEEINRLLPKRTVTLLGHDAHLLTEKIIDLCFTDDPGPHMYGEILKKIRKRHVRRHC